MPVIYNGHNIRPGPQVAFSTSFDRTGDGKIIGVTTTARLDGTLTASVDDGVFVARETNTRLGVILAKQKALRDIFAAEGKLFEVQGWDGSTPVKFNVSHVEPIEFSPGPWVDKCDYTITLRGRNFADATLPADLLCESASESWQFEEAEVPYSWKATHSVSAKGKRVFEADGSIAKPAYEVARDFVTARLGLGWDTRTAPGWSPASGSDLAGDSATSLPPGLSAWNRSVVETVDEADGTYAAVETWLLAANPYTERYTIAVRRAADQPGVVVTAEVDGEIQGLNAAQSDYAARYTNALAAWDTIRDLLYNRAVAAAGGTLNTRASSLEVDHDPTNGRISYRSGFDDRTIVGDAWETYSVSKKRSLEDRKTTVTVEGIIRGILYPGEDADPAIRLTRAALRWETVKGLLFARAVSDSGLNDLKAVPANAQVAEDHAEGTVSYSYDFDNRPSLLAEEDSTVSLQYNREDGRTTVTVEGTIRGFPSAGNDYFAASDPQDRYDNALAYFNAKEPNLIGVAALYVDTDGLNAVAWEKSVGHNAYAGTITYNYSFTTGLVCFPGAISESLSLQEEAAVPVIAEVAAMGVPDGPVIQDMGTVSARKRTFTAEVVFPRVNACGYIPPPAIDVSQYAPTATIVRKTQDVTNSSWTATATRVSRTVSWTYV